MGPGVYTEIQPKYGGMKSNMLETAPSHRPAQKQEAGFNAHGLHSHPLEQKKKKLMNGEVFRHNRSKSMIGENQLTLRNNRLEFKTVGKLLIILEEFIVEYNPI
jgi:hypothetical protein